jgi:hypothetical protein
MNLSEKQLTIQVVKGGTMENQKKQCKKCLNLVASTMFHANKGSKDGLAYYCKRCDAARRKERRAKETPALMIERRTKLGLEQPTSLSCGTCNGVFPIGSFYINNRTLRGYTFNCIPCNKKYSAEWIKANPDTYRSIRIKNKRDAIRRLSTPYIKHMLCQGTNASYSQIPQSLVEVKKIQMLIKRKVKELTK